MKTTETAAARKNRLSSYRLLLAMYGFCLTALCFLGISSAKPGYFLAGILFMIGTLFLEAADVPEEKPAPNN